MTDPSGGGEDARTIRGGRIAVGAAVAGVLPVLAASPLFPRGDGYAGLVAPASLLGLVSPVVGYRLYLWSLDRSAGIASPGGRRANYLRGVLLALAVAEVAAAFGLVAFVSTGRAWPLVGVTTLVLLAGAIWPTPERLEPFVRPVPGQEPGGPP